MNVKKMKQFLSILPGKLARYRIYLFIALPVVLFNCIAVFGPDVLLKDDAHMYNRVLNGQFPYFYWRSGLLLASLTEWAAWNIMVVSPQLIRAIYIIFLMVPLSWVIYRLFREKFGFPGVVAYTAAVLPNILPIQHLIPAFTNGSYVLAGLLVTLGCFYAGFNYLHKQDKKSWIRLAAAAVIYLLSIQLMDQSVFFFPVLVFAFLGYTRFNKKHIYLIASLSLVFLFKAAWILLSPRGAATISNIPYRIMLERTEFYFLSMLPFPQWSREWSYLPVILFAAALITGFAFYIKKRADGFHISASFSHMSPRLYVLYIYAFLLLWTTANISVFIAFSPGQNIRYFYISAYGLNALLLLSIYPLLIKIFKKRKPLIVLVFILLITISGISRHIRLRSHYRRPNANQAMIIKNLETLKFPPNSQIAVYLTNSCGYAWGEWTQSCGHLKYMLKRNDIDGLIGDKKPFHYFNFYNAFSRKIQYPYKPKMQGLDIHRPLFLFVQESNRLKQYEYALQWKGKTKHAPWTILHVNKITGTISPFTSGQGLEEYGSTIKKLEKQGISQSGILWGGPPTRKERERLQQVESDPVLFQFGFYESPLRFKKIKPDQANKAEHILFNSSVVEPYTNDISFGDKFRLLLSSADESARESAKTGKNKFIYLLWKSLEKQKIKKHALAITLVKGRKNVWGVWPEFCSAGLELEPGDYIFGCVKIPMDRFKEADYLGIRVNVLAGPARTVSLMIRGKRKTDQGGFRVLIPIER
jgi:hypothetical protein